MCTKPCETIGDSLKNDNQIDVWMLFIRLWMCYEARNSDCLRINTWSPAVCSLAIGGIVSDQILPNPMAEQTGGHISQGSADSATFTGKTCFMTVLWQISGAAWSELKIFKRKTDGRTITGTITKRYPKVTRRCLGPPLAQLLAFEALIYNACLLSLPLWNLLRSSDSPKAKPYTYFPQCMWMCLLSRAFVAAITVRGLLARARLYYQSYLSEAFCAAIAGRELCLSLNIKPCMPDLHMLAGRDWRLHKGKQPRI